jgi:drug/metabolite transporter (DMT)-like permease
MMRSHLLAAALAVVSAALLGLGAVLARIGVRYASVRVGASISVPITALCFWLLAPVLLRFDHASPKAAALFAAIGIFFPAAVTLLNFESARRLGPSIASALGTSTALFSAALAIVWLDERLSITMLIGTLIIVAGVVLIAFRQGAQPASFSVNWLLIPLAGAAIRATAQTAMKYALAIWPNPFAATLFSYTVSGMVLFGTRPAPVQIDKRRAALWFALAGLCNGGSVLAMYAALNAGPVTLVAPLATTSPLFAVLGSAVILREERFDRRLLFGVILTVIGAAFLVAR